MVRHLEDAAHVRGLLPIEEEIGLGRVGVGISRALEEPERGERVEKVPGRPRMEAEAPAERLEFLGAVGQFREHAHLDGAQECLGRPEGQAGLQNPLGGDRLTHPLIFSQMPTDGPGHRPHRAALSTRPGRWRGVESRPGPPRATLEPRRRPFGLRT